MISDQAWLAANKSANTEPQLQEVDSPQPLWPGCLQH